MTKKTLSLSDKAATALEQGSKSTDMNQSELASRAILEYTDQDRTARMESKLDQVLERLDDDPAPRGDTSGDSAPKKKKNTEGSERDDQDENTDSDHPDTSNPDQSDEKNPSDQCTTDVHGENIQSLLGTDEIYTREAYDSYEDHPDQYLDQGPLSIEDNQTQGTTNRMYNYLILRYAQKPVPFIPQEWLTEAITELGGNSDHYISKYTKLLMNCFEDDGWRKHPAYDSFYLDDDEFSTHIGTILNEVADVLNRGADISDVSVSLGEVKSVVNSSGDLRGFVDDHDIDNEADIKDALRNAEAQFTSICRKKRVDPDEVDKSSNETLDRYIGV